VLEKFTDRTFLVTWEDWTFEENIKQDSKETLGFVFILFWITEVTVNRPHLG
jgi:hypothetical protein